MASGSLISFFSSHPRFEQRLQRAGAVNEITVRQKVADFVFGELLGPALPKPVQHQCTRHDAFIAGRIHAADIDRPAQTADEIWHFAHPVGIRAQLRAAIEFLKRLRGAPQRI